MENNKNKSSDIWTKLNSTVNPVVAWGIFGGALAIATVLALIFWL